MAGEVLPTVNGDNEVWGTKLNNWLLVSHNDDGSIKSTALAGGGSTSGGLSVLQYKETATNLVSTNASTWKTGIFGADQLGASFVAPTSGIVYITLTGHLVSSGSNGGALTCFVNAPGGSAVSGFAAGAEGLTMYANPTSYHGGSITRRVSGLTGGLTYSAVTATQVSGTSGTLTASFRAILVLG